MAKKKHAKEPKHHDEAEADQSQSAAAAAAVHKPNTSVDAAAASEKLENLKSLNSVVIKQLQDRKHQVESLLKAKEGLECQLSRFGELESRIGEKSEENYMLELEKSVLCVVVVTQMGKMAEEVGEREAEVEMLKREVNELVGSVEKEKGEVSRVCRERDLVKRELDGVLVEANGLRGRVLEMEKRERCVGDEMEELKSKCVGLVKEKEEKEREVMREKDVAERKRVELESVIVDLRKEVVRIVREKSEVDKAKVAQESRVSELEKEVGELEKCESRLRKEKEWLHKKVLELGGSLDEARAKEDKMVREIKGLVGDVKEKEDCVVTLNEEVKSQKAILDMVTVELENKQVILKEINHRKDEVEAASAKKDGEIDELKKEVRKQRDGMFKLQTLCNELEAENAKLVSEVRQYKDAVDCAKLEWDEAQKGLAEERKMVENLKRAISERDKSAKVLEQFLGTLKSEHADISQNNKELERRLESLMKEKETAQKSLSDAQRKVHDWKVKCELAETNSKQALSMLKKTAALVALKTEAKREVNVNEQSVGEEVHPYAAEFDAIHTAFRNNEKTVEVLKQQLEESERSVVKAEKRKSFWTLVSSATMFVAAATVAYASKGR